MNVLSKVLSSWLLLVLVVCGCATEERSETNAAVEAAKETEQVRKRELIDFQSCELCPQGLKGCTFIFEQAKFPEIRWRGPYQVEKVMGKFPLKVRWFDAELNEVTVPEKPGRYAAVVEGVSPDGIHIRRAITLYRRVRDWRPWEDDLRSYLEYPAGGPIDKEAWEERKDMLTSRAGKQFRRLLGADAWSAVLLSYLVEMKPVGGKPARTDTPEIRNSDFHLALKRKLLGVENKYSPLKMPRKVKGKPAPVLCSGTPQEAGVKPETAEKIRAVCRQWYAQSKEPFVILVARHGVIIIHEAFGEGPRGPVTIDTPMWIASITKALTGSMFAQFVDQGLIGIDEPVGKFLPDFPTEGDKAITLRHCFTHTTGLEGHNRWGGVHNPWLDNVIANGLSYLKPGDALVYNGVGYDLAGKVMEVVSGKSILRLMHEDFFGPLGMKNTTIDDMGGATTTTRSTAEDLARIGQLLLNKGSYGELEFFSPETFEKLLPQPLSRFYPKIKPEWGIGLVWMRQRHPKAGENDVPADKTVLSRNVIGHGAASSAILRVDLDNDLVITQTRNRAGIAYKKYLVQFLMAIEDGLVR